MSRRTALPGAAELFRSTGTGRPSPDGSAVAAELPVQLRASAPAPPDDADRLGGQSSGTEVEDSAPDWDSPRPARRKARPVADRRPTGRERHDEKITVYVSADELLDLEHARLALRGDHGLPVDRGRVVREALAVVLADFEAKGDASILVRRLRGR